MTTLPQMAGVAPQLHTLAGRPPFMLLREIADVFGIEVHNLSRQFRRNQERFPAGYYFVLEPGEYREKLNKNCQTSQGSRADLEQFAFTESGALFLIRFIKSRTADAASIAMIEGMTTDKDYMIAEMRQQLAIDRQAYIEKRVIRSRILTAVAEGWSYTTLKDAYGYSNPELATAIEAMRVRGYIASTALLVPLYVLRKMAENKAWLNEHVEDTRQLLLGLEG